MRSEQDTQTEPSLLDSNRAAATSPGHQEEQIAEIAVVLCRGGGSGACDAASHCLTVYG